MLHLLGIALSLCGVGGEGARAHTRRGLSSALRSGKRRKGGFGTPPAYPCLPCRRFGRPAGALPWRVLQLEHPAIALSTRNSAVANRRAVSNILAPSLQTRVTLPDDSLPARFISDRICFSPLRLS